jgi:aromatic ring-cleaving dioxygenase
MMFENHDAPYHAHIYFDANERTAAERLRADLETLTAPESVPCILFVGRMTDGPAGPHPIPQYEVHFRESARNGVEAMIDASGLRALIHPLTDHDLNDHTTLAHWIGEPVTLDVTVLDPPGHNQGVPRFGLRDF